MYLEKINSPKDLKEMNIEELKKLADEMRAALLNRLSKTGGHIGPNLGMVEAIIAMHYVSTLQWINLYLMYLIKAILIKCLQEGKMLIYMKTIFMMFQVIQILRKVSMICLMLVTLQHLSVWLQD